MISIQTENEIKRQARLEFAAEIDALRARAEAAEAEARLWQNRTREAAAVVGNLEAEVERLRQELEVTRNLLRDAPDYGFPWCQDVSDYLETIGD